MKTLFRALVWALVYALAFMVATGVWLYILRATTQPVVSHTLPITTQEDCASQVEWRQLSF